MKKKKSKLSVVIFEKRFKNFSLKFSIQSWLDLNLNQRVKKNYPFFNFMERKGKILFFNKFKSQIIRF